MLGRTHFVAHHSGEGEPAHAVQLIKRVLAAGVPVVRLRSEHSADRARYDLARAIAYLCRQAGATFLVDDRVDIALAAGADGVHLGDQGIPVREARRLLGPGAVVGATTRNAADARRLVREGATYLGTGPCYPGSALGAIPSPVGPAGIPSVASLAGVPVIATGGVSEISVPELMSAGAYGVAVRGALAGAQDPEAAARSLLAAVGRAAPVA